MVVEPVATPVTLPEASTVAMALLALLQVPPDVASDKLTNEPTHTTDEPDMVPAVGRAVTVMADVAVAVLQPVVTV